MSTDLIDACDNNLSESSELRFEKWVNRRWAVGSDKPNLSGQRLSDGRWVYYAERTSELFSAYCAGEYYAPKEPNATEGSGQ